MVIHFFYFLWINLLSLSKGTVKLICYLKFICHLRLTRIFFYFSKSPVPYSALIHYLQTYHSSFQIDAKTTILPYVISTGPTLTALLLKIKKKIRKSCRRIQLGLVHQWKEPSDSPEIKKIPKQNAVAVQFRPAINYERLSKQISPHRTTRTARSHSHWTGTYLGRSAEKIYRRSAQEATLN